MYRREISFRELVDSTIEKEIRKKRPLVVVHGGRALNVLMTPEYRKPTRDWDLYTKKPEKYSRRIEKKLDKAFHYDIFSVKGEEEELHDGRPLYTVRNHFTGQRVCDCARFPPRRKGGKPRYVVVGDIRYETLADAKRMCRQILANQDSKFRWDKTYEDLNRIIAFEKKLKKAKNFKG